MTQKYLLRAFQEDKAFHRTCHRVVYTPKPFRLEGQVGALEAAAGSNDLARLTHLLGDVRWTDVDLHLGLVQAVGQNCLDCASCLLQHGARPEVACGVRHEPLLVLAVRRSNLDLVVLLARHGCNLNERTRSGRAALHEALAQGKAGTKLLEALLERGANPDAQDLVEGCSPLTLALRSGNVVQLQMLISAGCLVDRVNQGCGTTPLMEAADRGDLEAVTLLLAAGARPDVRGKGERTALHVAACYGRLQVARRLLAVGSHLDSRDVLGLTPPMLAAKGGHLQLTEMFVQSGCSLEARSLHDETLLHLAAGGGLTSCVAELTSSMTDADVRDAVGRSPLSCAVEGRHADVVRLLVQRGLDPNVRARCRFGGDVLMSVMNVALLNADLATARLLLEARSCSVQELKSLEKSTALQATLKSRRDVAAWLSDAARGPPSLLSACRHSIRQRLRHRDLHHRDVKRLRLPTFLQEYVMFETV